MWGIILKELLSGRDPRPALGEAATLRPAEPKVVPLHAELFEDLACEYLAYQAPRSRSLRSLASNLRILARYLGRSPLSEIGPAQIEAMIGQRLKEGMSRGTCNRQRAGLSGFFTWAISRGYHPGPNPVKGVKQFRESAGRTRYLSEEEAKRLILAAAVHLKKIIVAALHSGGRLSELLTLRWADVDLERHVIVFRRENTKSRRERVVPIDPELDATLRSLRPGPPADLVFEYNGRRMKSLRTAFEHAREKAGVPDVHFHDLRHTFASWYIQNGGDPYRLQKYLGHSTMAMTERYTHLSPAFVQDGVRFFGPPRRPEQP